MSAPNLPVPLPAGGEVLDPRSPATRLVDAWLDGRSPETMRAYRADLQALAAFLGAASAELAVQAFLALPAGGANERALAWRSAMVAAALSPATINRRLAALRSVVKLGRTLGMVSWSIEIGNVKVEAYRDTRGPGEDGYRKLLAAIPGDTTAGLRDRAIVRLLYERVLRRGEVCRLSLGSISADGSRITIRGKGRTQDEVLRIAAPTAEAIRLWRAVRPGPADDPAAPLLVSLSTGSRGHRLTGESVRRIVHRAAERAGLKCWPHALRHAGITSALDRTQGDVRKVMTFSRHKRLDTLMIYDDHRRDDAGGIADLVAGDG